MGESTREENGMDTNASKQRHFELMGLEIPFPFFFSRNEERLFSLHGLFSGGVGSRASERGHKVISSALHKGEPRFVRFMETSKDRTLKKREIKQYSLLSTTTPFQA